MVLDSTRLSVNGWEHITQINSVHDRVVQRLRHLRGEWFVNQNSGVPYFSLFNRNIVQPGLLESEIQHEVELVEGVLTAAVTATETSPRNYSVEVRVTTDFGDDIFTLDI